MTAIAGAQRPVPLASVQTQSSSVQTPSKKPPKIGWSRPWHSVAWCCTSLLKGLTWCWKTVRDSIESQGGGATCPRAETVLLSLLLLLTFLIVSIFAIKYPTIKVKRTVIVLNAVLASVLGVVFLHDLKTKNGRALKKTSVNTVLTVTLTIIVLTTLYSQLWYRGLNDIVIRLETDNVRHPQFPAVAFFQRQEPTQASVQPGDLKCSSGPRNDHAIQCSSLSIAEAVTTSSCDCGDSWPSLENLQRGGYTVKWLAKNTSYYPMVPSPSTISRGAGHFLEMQVFFSYNTSEVFNNVSLITAPGIWMAIYDPSFGLDQMMEDSQLYTAQIDANSHTVVNIGLRYYTYLNKTPNYKYEVTVSTRQNLDLVCDVTKVGWWLCHLTVEMQIPSSFRTIVREERKQDWTRVVADAGAYFALVQFLSWLASGMAWA